LTVVPVADYEGFLDSEKKFSYADEADSFLILACFTLEQVASA
jgi:hypothetical protein